MTETSYRQIPAFDTHGIVSVCDHASNHVPDGIELGVGSEVLEKHIARDIGAAGVVERMARRHGIPAHLGEVSRLVIDLHREEEVDGLIPTTSDGILIPGNIGADREGRIEKYYRPYHDALAAWLDEQDPQLILSIHSFTPELESKPGEERPWEIGLLYNEDDRAAQHAIRLFGELGVTVGDNEPYSGKLLNATMNRHAEAHGRPYCAIEIRNDLIANEAGQARYAAMIADVAGRVLSALASN
ncbi:N-formylglutamate amidohydrolase [Alteraurantiacibacter aquimixticola]|uniref:N-formylglutamate amidohydrolase n=1 Tax=Alteraurantiacibacter aquimixticola TaxID=2489173 RepID=A0A4T3F1P6_9SPHN|nr:N-formylglutamate amidohydrolase [Alteraurantiacibacter aquimixticola]TIX49950.1 N-formylglutamate amidohydrolase [Alteraurantiacibacter aquimixticola]